jgi:hypothetical protein
MDIRVYYLDGGILRKVRHNHKVKSIGEAILVVERYRQVRYFQRKQFVIQEFTGIYESKIVELL